MRWSLSALLAILWRCPLGVFALLALIGCGAQQTTGFQLANLQAPEQLMLFSLDGRDVDASGERRRGQGVPPATGEFHGYPVLGQVDVADPERRKQLVAALKEGYARRPASGAKCFWPRHGIRVVEKSQTVEYVICFECSWFDQYLGGTKSRRQSINGDVQAVFDKPLEEAGVPIAPK